MNIMTKLLLLFILVPALELFLLIELGQFIGTLATLALIALTGMLGAFLARRQGIKVLQQVQVELAAGQIPTGSIVDGVIILVAGAVLITPGILTDTVGFLCLIPATRSLIKRAVWRWLERTVQAGRIHYSANFEVEGQASPPKDIHDPHDS